MLIFIKTMLRRGSKTALAALTCFICLLHTHARATDYYYEAYSGEPVRIVVNSYGQSSVQFFYSTYTGTTDSPHDMSYDLIYTSAAGFVGEITITTKALAAPDYVTVVASDTHHITVKPRITFSSSSWPNAKKGEVYSRAVTASYSASSTVVSYSITSGSLPPGLNLNSSSGTISGTPSTTGSWTFTYQVINADGYSSNQSMTLKVGPSTSDLSTTVSANSSGNQVAVPMTGTESLTGVSAPAHGTASYSGSTLSYTPAAGYSGSDSFTYTVTESESGLSDTATVTVTVTAPALVLSPTNLPGGTANVAYSQTLSATNGTSPYSFAVTGGVLPSGLTLSTSGALSGTPTTQGSETFEVTSTDTYGATGTQSYTLDIAIAAPIVADVSAIIDANSTDTPISLDLAGGTADSVSVVTSAQHGTAVASGTSIAYTPTPGYSGIDTFTYAATNSTGTSVAATVTVTVSKPTLGITPTTLPGGVANSSYSQTLSASSGTAPYSFTVTSGDLPDGLTLSSDGTLSGSPTADGSQTFEITATDSLGATGSQSYTLAIAIAAPTVGDVVASVDANSTDNVITLDLSGGAADSVEIASAPNHGTATATGTSITYTPEAGYSGDDSFTYTATNSTGSSAPATVSITVGQPILAITPDGVLSLRQAETFSQTFIASNGTAPYSYAITGTLPDGLTFDTSSGTLSGTATETGSFPVYMVATDAYGATGTANLTLQVDDALPVAPALTVSTNSGRTITIDLTEGATGGPFTGADLVSLSPASAGTAVIVLDDTAATSASQAISAAYAAGRYKLRFTANVDFTGTVTATYTLTSASGTSAPASVQMQVAARPILSADADLVGLLEAQASAARRLAKAQTDTVNDHLKSLHGKACLENTISLSLSDSSDGKAPVSANAGCSPLAEGDLAFWSAGSIDLGDSDSLSGESAFDFATVSVTGGLDYRLSDTVIGGISIGYSRDRAEIGSDGTTSINRAASATVYGLYQPGGGLFVDGLIGAGLLDFDSVRITSSTGAEAEASRSGRQVFAAISGGYDYRQDDLTISTYGRLAASHSILESAEESGADWENALFGRQESNSLTTTVGASFSYDLQMDEQIVRPELSLDFSHDFSDTSDTTVTYADDSWTIDYVVAGNQTRRDSLTVGLGVTLLQATGATLRGRYSATLDLDGLQSQRLALDLGGKF